MAAPLAMASNPPTVATVVCSMRSIPSLRVSSPEAIFPAILISSIPTCTMLAIVDAGVPLGITFIMPFSTPTFNAPAAAALIPKSAPVFNASSTISLPSISSPSQTFLTTFVVAPIATPSKAACPACLPTPIAKSRALYSFQLRSFHFPDCACS